MNAALAQVTTFMKTHDILVPHKNILEWHLLKGSWQHPLFGSVSHGITDGVTCYIVTARGTFHASLGQMSRVTNEPSARPARSQPTKKARPAKAPLLDLKEFI